MTFLSFFRYIELVSIAAAFLTLLMIVASPMGRYLKSGVITLTIPTLAMNYFYGIPKTGSIILDLISKYSMPNFSNFAPYHVQFLWTVGQKMTEFNSLFPILINLSCGLGICILFRSIAKRFMNEFDKTTKLVSGLSVIVAAYITWGLAIPALAIVVAFTTSRTAIRRIVISGKGPIVDGYAGIFIIKLLLMFRLKDGIFIHKGIRIPRSFERRSFIIFGTPGSGKSVLMASQFLAQTRARGDKHFIFDYKREFIEQMGEDDDALIISPIDARSVIWDISKDIDTEARASEFGAMIVQKGDAGKHDHIFEDWAKDLLIASLVKLIAEKKTYTFKDFFKESQDLDTLVSAVEKYRPEADFVANFDKDDSRQAEGIKGTIRRSMARLEPLSRAWGDITEPTRLFSIREWIASKNPHKKTIIFGYDEQYSEILAPFASNFINVLLGYGISLPDAKGKNRNRSIWIALDECQELPKIPRLYAACRTGRSKGIKLLLGTQDMGRMEQIYKDKGGEDTLMNLIGFKFIGHLGSQKMQKFASDQSSHIRVETQKRTVSNDSKGRRSVSRTSDVNDIAALPSGEFASIGLPTSWNGAEFWIVHQGWNPIKLRYILNVIPVKYPDLVPELWLSDQDRDWKIAQISEEKSKTKAVIVPTKDKSKSPEKSKAKSEKKTVTKSVKEPSQVAKTPTKSEVKAPIRPNPKSDKKVGISDDFTL